MSLPGSPLVYVGHNRDMAWGFVAALCDDGDLWNEFLSRMKQHVTPSLNCVYADTRGNIGYALTGEASLASTPGTSWLPLDGWNAAHDWTGTIPFDEMPRGSTTSRRVSSPTQTTP